MKFATLLLIATIAISSSGCRKKRYNPVLKDAIITGYDYRKCFCCGGLMLTYGQDPEPYAEPFRLISNPPSYFGFTDSTKYPVYVKVYTVEDQTRCPGSYVVVRNFELK